MMARSRITRRGVLSGASNVLTASAFAAMGGFRALAATEGTIGFIYVGPRDDYGWNQAHAVAAASIAEAPGISLVEQERVPETEEVARVMEGMIQLDGVKVLFPTSFGYWPFIQELAPKYPDVLFIHAGGLWKPGDQPNTIGYRGYMEEPHYLAGIAAGHLSKTGKLGFIGAKPLYFVFNNCNGLTLGARSVNPEATTQVVITGEWNNPVKEADAVNAMIDQGVDVICANVDSPKVAIETAERRGVMSVGYHTDQSDLAPKGFLTGAEWNWAKGGDFAMAHLADAEFPNLYRGGFDREMVKISPFGAAVPDEVRAEIMAARDGFLDGSLLLYQGPLMDNNGNTVVEDGTGIPNDDNDFKLSVKWLVEGVTGETGLE
ncbi:MAG: BMP family ABC transporter substrate-binding protein [Pseudomonadota bacterium]